MKTVVLVSGKLQSGKNSFADMCMEYLKDKTNTSFDFFAKELKERCKEDFSDLISFINKLCETFPPEIREQLYTQDENWFENKNQLTRILLQLYGTNIFRNRVDTDYWAKQVVENVYNSESKIIFITDVRFPSEIKALQNMEHDYGYNIITIRINRGIDRDAEFNQHESETALDNYEYFDYVFENNGTVEELREKAENFSRMIYRIETDYSN
jgi:uridine kinase